MSDKQNCPTVWGTHGCDLPPGHEGRHQCIDTWEGETYVCSSHPPSKFSPGDHVYLTTPGKDHGANLIVESAEIMLNNTERVIVTNPDFPGWYGDLPANCIEHQDTP